MKAEKIVFFTGAGVSAESGVKTFRDSGGLWEDHSIYDVATPEAFERDPETVLEFYNQRRRQMYEVEPNAAHRKIAELQSDYEVEVVTQNVDNLHERAGSKTVLHLHGELDKGRSSKNEVVKVDLRGKDIKLGDKAPDGSQLRPHVVWFGEAVPALDEAANMIASADVLVIAGTSLQVYPAAGLVHYAPDDCDLYYIDPKAEIPLGFPESIMLIKEKAGEGMKILADLLEKKS